MVSKSGEKKTKVSAKPNSEKGVLELIDLSGKTAVVTGGGGHLGYQMSLALLELGAEVIVIGRDKNKIDGLAKKFGKRVSFVETDLNDRDKVLDLARELPKRIDVLINNAYTWPKNPHFEKMVWDEVVGTLVSWVVSPLFMSKLAFEKMNNGGSIIK